MIFKIILIGIGGGAGSILRYLTSVFVEKHFQHIFPIATFAVNFIGCLLMGLLLGLFEQQQIVNSNLKFLFVTGFCGGYTTFSAFSAENMNLFQSENSTIAFVYILLSVFICIAAVWAGFVTAQFIFKTQ
ncbi:MAG: fluoride efflux transporter CrcB [Prevotellaceae bacterium]|jgi:CrcB protein|nr:fluoride efflux transporter CrcB [Prevotellaceae bacterium]